MKTTTAPEEAVMLDRQDNQFQSVCCRKVISLYGSGLWRSVTNRLHYTPHPDPKGNLPLRGFESGEFVVNKGRSCRRGEIATHSTLSAHLFQAFSWTEGAI